VSCLSTQGNYIVREGDPVTEMLFIIRGKLESSTTNGGRTGFFMSITLRPGDFCSVRAACLSIASKIYSQLTFFHKDSESTKRSGSTCIASRTSSSSPISLDLKIFCKHKERGAKDVEMRKLQNLKSQTSLQN
jgi:hypothetical protein